MTDISLKIAFYQDKEIIKQSEIVLSLNEEKAPKTCENFLNYVKSGFYNETIFHRVINNFMIQGGGFDKEMKQKSTNPEIENEANNGLKNEKYTIAMARTNEPHSATSQFFINTVNNDFLNFSNSNFGYAVFGKVVKGTEVVDEISKVKTKNHGHHADVPVDLVVVENIEVI